MSLREEEILLLLYFFEKVRSWMGRDRYTVLREEELDMIHNASLELLKSVGCKIEHPRMLQILKEKGMKVDFKSMVVRFYPDLVEEVISRHRREYELPKGEPRARLSVGGLTTNIHDPELGSMRLATKDDLQKATIIGDALEAVTNVGPLFVPQNVSSKTCDIHMAEVLLTRTKKRCGFEIFNKHSVRYIFDMCAIAVGGQEKVRRSRMFTFYSFIQSPFRYTFSDLEIAFETLDIGMPVRFAAPMVVVGMTAPITLAGALALSNAESLIGFVLSDATGQEPCYAASPATIDPASGVACYSGPERAILALTSLDFGRYYGVPTGAHIGYTDARFPGIQAAFEKCYGAMLFTWAGMNISISTAGLLGPGGRSGSFEQIIIDTEFTSAFDRLLKGIEIDEEHLALDFIKKVGIGGNFIREWHNLKRFRETLWFPKLFTRETLTEKVEGDDVYDRARQKVKEILATHNPHPLDRDEERRIKELTKEAERRY